MSGKLGVRGDFLQGSISVVLVGSQQLPVCVVVRASLGFGSTNAKQLSRCWKGLVATSWRYSLCDCFAGDVGMMEIRG